MRTPAETATAFFNALSARNFDRALTLVSDDILYHNMPLVPLRGKKQFETFLRPWTDLNDEISILIHSILIEGERVAIERTDRDRHDGQPWVSTRAAAFMTIQVGQICVWHDYYDLNSFCLQNGRDYGAIVQSARDVANLT